MFERFICVITKLKCAFSICEPQSLPLTVMDQLLDDVMFSGGSVVLAQRLTIQTGGCNYFQVGWTKNAPTCHKGRDFTFSSNDSDLYMPFVFRH